MQQERYYNGAELNTPDNITSINFAKALEGLPEVERNSTALLLNKFDDRTLNGPMLVAAIKLFKKVKYSYVDIEANGISSKEALETMSQVYNEMKKIMGSHDSYIRAYERDQKKGTRHKLQTNILMDIYRYYRMIVSNIDADNEPSLNSDNAILVLDSEDEYNSNIDTDSEDEDDGYF